MFSVGHQQEHSSKLQPAMLAQKRTWLFRPRTSLDFSAPSSRFSEDSEDSSVPSLTYDSSSSFGGSRPGSESASPPSSVPSSPLGSGLGSCGAHGCSLEESDTSGDWIDNYRDFVDFSEACPARYELDGVAGVPVFDAAGNSRPFASFYSGDGVVGERQLIVFIRHFFCGACQAYVKALTESITPSVYFTMPIPTSIVIIGCGSPALIPHYKAVTGTPYPVFADPSRRLFKGLGMTWTLDSGRHTPDYMRGISKPQWLRSQISQVVKVKGRRRFQGGNVVQVGGEFLFTEGEVMWCHRMKNFRDHTEIKDLRKVLQIDE